MPMGQRRRDRFHKRRFVAGISLMLAIVIVLAGCAGEDDPLEVTPVATPLPTAGPMTRLGDVTWTASIDETGAPIEPLSEMPRDIAVIYAVVEVEMVPAGESLSAAWTLDEAPIDAISATVTIDQASETGWVSFSLAWEGESLWPVGRLGVTITASSGATTTGTIQIGSG